MKYSGTFWQESGTVLAGAPAAKIIELCLARGFAVTIAPNAGGTAAVETTLATPAEIAAATAIWMPLGATVADAALRKEQQTPVSALRITATTQPCKFEVLQ